mmetsp:Transcript_29003/g.61546  ORF Transcript_29003/g.61546 Transcript_29003/m.61546 type:complete len:532 (+) Transcript_29003:42-1637(+)
MASSSSSASNSNDRHILEKLQKFTIRHTSHHIPVALVTSGGTAAPLEHNCVRFLDNFSTGSRGAYAVEEFCKRGYAVIHLKREGSVAPFGRILGDVLKCGKGGPNFDSLGALFDCDISEEEEEEDYFGVQDIEGDESGENKAPEGNIPIDPWMYSRDNQRDDNRDQIPKSISRSRRRGDLLLNPRLVTSPLLQSTLRTYKHIKNQGLLLTIDFRTVDEYLHKLQLCSKALNTCGSLALVYLAAAVSDFYIPDEKKVLHKIQSRDYGIKSQASSSASSFGEDSESEKNTIQIQSDNTLTLTLYPVPKVIPSLRKQWCPNAFVISFKLETDSSILWQKSVMAMERNNVHLVIGNELSTRYDKVFILSRKDDAFDSLDVDEPISISSDAVGEAFDFPEGYRIAEVTASHTLAMSSPSPGTLGSSNKVDALEFATIEYVARRHFHYISTNINNCGGEALALPMSSAAEMAAHQTLQAASIHEKRLDSDYRQLQRERLKVRLAELAWNMAGTALGMALSYGIARALQGRQQGMTLR